MDFGCVLRSKADSYEDAALAERLGYSHAWLYDSPLLCADVYAAMAACALKTKKIVLGSGVTNPRSRIAPVTACAIATVNGLAPGRVVLGIGTGNTARRTLGMPPARVAEMREHIEICRAMLAGKTADYQEGGRRSTIGFVDPKSGWINITDKIPIYVAASGAKALEIAGEVADGVILFGAVGGELIEFAMDRIRAGAKRAGRNPRRIYVLCMTVFYLTQPEQSLESLAVRRAVGPFVASSSNIFAMAAQDATELPTQLRDSIMSFGAAYRAPSGSAGQLQSYRGYLKNFRKEHESLVTERMIRATTLTGTRDELIATIRSMAKAGIHQVAIQPIAGTAESLRSFYKEIARNVG